MVCIIHMTFNGNYTLNSRNHATGAAYLRPRPICGFTGFVWRSASMRD